MINISSLFMLGEIDQTHEQQTTSKDITQSKILDSFCNTFSTHFVTVCPLFVIRLVRLPYARNYNLRFVYFSPHFAVRFIIKRG